jgi:hypothetical protein
MDDFSLRYSFHPHYYSRVDSASNRNEYQVALLGVKGGRCIGLTTLPPSYADCRRTAGSFSLLEPLRACPVLYRECFLFDGCAFGSLCYQQHLYTKIIKHYFLLGVCESCFKKLDARCKCYKCVHAHLLQLSS